jgi:glycine cleavage system H protein
MKTYKIMRALPFVMSALGLSTLGALAVTGGVARAAGGPPGSSVSSHAVGAGTRPHVGVVYVAQVRNETPTAFPPPCNTQYCPEAFYAKQVFRGVYMVGFSQWAISQMGSPSYSAVYVSLPAVDQTLATGQRCGELKMSDGSVYDIYAPLTGVVTTVNKNVESDPSIVTSDPPDAWLFEMKQSG